LSDTYDPDTGDLIAEAENNLVHESGRFPPGTGDAKKQVLDDVRERTGTTTNRVVGHPSNFFADDINPGIGQRKKDALDQLSEISETGLPVEAGEGVDPEGDDSLSANLPPMNVVENSAGPEDDVPDEDEGAEVTDDDPDDSGTDDDDGDGDTDNNERIVAQQAALSIYEAREIINGLDSESFNTAESAAEMAFAIDDVSMMLDEGMYFEVLVVLEDDILARTDGCATIGEPDEDDWIISFEGQEAVYPIVLETIELLENLT
jgi:hypothetical protein